ncbi:MAG: hypothetical protein KatS3mg076_2053 [Candidatus Binatia bacterium]|nr:MAG: hypothetical protein KatS3mg076_2053 [Candidatus Binatia bacterium]
MGLLLLFALGLLSKESTAVLPAVFCLADYFRGRTWPDGALPSSLPPPGLRQILGRRKWVYLGCLVLAFPYLLHRVAISRHTGYMADAGWIGGTIGSHVLSAAKAQLLLLWRLLFPLRLVADYSPRHWIYASGWTDPVGWVAVVALGSAVLLTVRSFRRNSWAGFAGAFMVATMLPTSQVVRLTELVAEHYLYVPLLGFGILVARLDAALRRNPLPYAPLAATAAITALAVFYAGRCWLRNRDYRNSLVFWKAVERDAPENARAQVSLGVWERLAGVPPHQYIKRFERAIELDPKISSGWANLGFELMRQQRYAEAEKALDRALELEPNAAEFRAGMAALYLSQWRISDAEPYLEWLRKHDPRNPKLEVMELLLERMRRGER